MSNKRESRRRKTMIQSKGIRSTTFAGPAATHEGATSSCKEMFYSALAQVTEVLIDTSVDENFSFEQFA